MPTAQQRADSKRRQEKGLAYCGGCKTEKPLDNFTAVPTRRPSGVRDRCKLCYAADERGRNRQQSLQRYGLSKAEYAELFEKQKGLCAICGNAEITKSKHGKIHFLSVDHCHKSEKVRGLLCRSCNLALGKFNDSKETLQRAISYLEKNYG